AMLGQPAHNGVALNGTLNGNGNGNGNGTHEIAGTPVSGRVRRTDGTSAAGAVLTLINHGGQQVARGTSGDDGGYQLVAPLDGTYVLIASSAGHQTQASP